MTCWPSPHERQPLNPLVAVTQAFIFKPVVVCVLRILPLAIRHVTGVDGAGTDDLACCCNDRARAIPLVIPGSSTQLVQRYEPIQITLGECFAARFSRKLRSACRLLSSSPWSSGLAPRSFCTTITSTSSPTQIDLEASATTFCPSLPEVVPCPTPPLHALRPYWSVYVVTRLVAVLPDILQGCDTCLVSLLTSVGVGSRSREPRERRGH